MYWMRKNEPRQVEKILGVSATKREISRQPVANSTKGKTLYILLPDVNWQLRNFIHQPKQFSLPYRRWPEHLSGFNLKDDNECHCKERRTAKHVVLHCPITEGTASPERTILHGMEVRSSQYMCKHKSQRVGCNSIRRKESKVRIRPVIGNKTAD